MMTMRHLVACRVCVSKQCLVWLGIVRAVRTSLARVSGFGRYPTRVAWLSVARAFQDMVVLASMGRAARALPYWVSRASLGWVSRALLGWVSWRHLVGSRTVAQKSEFIAEPLIIIPPLSGTFSRKF